MLPCPGLLCGAPRSPGNGCGEQGYPHHTAGVSWLAQPQLASAPMGSTVTLVLLPGHLQPSTISVLATIWYPAKHLCSEQEPWH